jgi:hypothetical protein
MKNAFHRILEKLTKPLSEDGTAGSMISAVQGISSCRLFWQVFSQKSKPHVSWNSYPLHSPRNTAIGSTLAARRAGFCAIGERQISDH